MTTEPSNGTASDDQRCYIERLQAIETAARLMTIHYSIRESAFESTVSVQKHLWDALKTALEANR